jgi:hypothetical protein
MITARPDHGEIHAARRPERTDSAQPSGHGLSAESDAHHDPRVEAEVVATIELDDDHVQTVIERRIEDSLARRT